jgi:hypothetical protein
VRTHDAICYLKEQMLDANPKAPARLQTVTEPAFNGTPEI